MAPSHGWSKKSVLVMEGTLGALRLWPDLAEVRRWKANCQGQYQEQSPEMAQ